MRIFMKIKERGIAGCIPCPYIFFTQRQEPDFPVENGLNDTIEK
jgi:hypothetical protein